ncbi:MAG: sigma-70 family RNA polymerase sigma factor [Planctomycetota bacterium]
MLQSDDNFSRLQTDHDAAALERVIQEYWPLVLSVCRAQLHDEHEAEDATQETFLKLARQHHTITGNLAAWLTTVARTTAIDRLRRIIRQRQRHERLAESRTDPQAESRARLLQQAVLSGLPEALSAMDTTASELLRRRFLVGTPLRLLAADAEVSVATMSRRVATAVEQASLILEDMGLLGAGDLDLSELLQRLGGMGAEYFRDGHDWLTPEVCPSDDAGTGPLPATRRRRVGVVLSHEAIVTPNKNKVYIQEEEPGFMLRVLKDADVDLVALIDPGTADLGIIERLRRDYEIHAGLAHATDLAALETLDVIIMGLCFSLPYRVLRAVHAAVRAGVGLINDGWTAEHRFGANDPLALDLNLCRARRPHICRSDHQHFHNPGCVVAHHPATVGLPIGWAFETWGCGGFGVVKPDAQVIATTASTHPDEPPERPCLIAGSLGHGRVLSFDTVHGYRIIQNSPRPAQLFGNILDWLARPSRGIGV